MATDLSFLNNLNPTQKTPSNTQQSSGNSKKSSDPVSDFIKNFKSLMGVVGGVASTAAKFNPVTAGISTAIDTATRSREENANNAGRGVQAGITSANPLLGAGMGLGNLALNNLNNNANTQPAEVQTETVDVQSTTPEESTAEKTDTNDDDVIEYTYKRGDTFGQVIKDLGLKTDKGLWGSDGDVAYYTKQLREQGIPGMVPIGTTIRLKRRK